MSSNRERKIIIEKSLSKRVLELLLKDRTTEKNIVWATYDYIGLGFLYYPNCEISIDDVCNETYSIIKPGFKKNKVDKSNRAKEKGEVFTPAYVCNIQNNYIDNLWFGKNKKRFNTELDRCWKTNYYPVYFPNIEDKSWKDYVCLNRLEVSCGEAPYLTSRYDSVSGKYYPVKNRIGILDRKLRVVSENTKDEKEWIYWTKESLKSIYGYEFQGDNLLIARKNVILTVIEFFYEKYKKCLNENVLLDFVDIVTWNLWQMDGLKYVIPNTCGNSALIESCVGDEDLNLCLGCKKDNIFLHNGIYSKIKDWKTGEIIEFIKLKGANR